jgi:uncharacterized protein CbrC (UPF0167 family)
MRSGSSSNEIKKSTDRTGMLEERTKSAKWAQERIQMRFCEMLITRMHSTITTFTCLLDQGLEGRLRL